MCTQTGVLLIYINICCSLLNTILQLQTNENKSLTTHFFHQKKFAKRKKIHIFAVQNIKRKTIIQDSGIVEILEFFIFL